MTKRPDDWTIEEKRALTGRLWVEGREGYVGGAKGRFAQVRWFSDGSVTEYSWCAIERLKAKQEVAA